MKSFIIEKVEFDVNEITIGKANSLHVQFIMNGVRGSAKVDYDENLKLKVLYDFELENSNVDTLTNLAAKHYVSRSIQSQFQSLLNEK